MNEFSILSRFLERYGHEVEGRAAQPPPPEMRESLRQWAQGNLPPEQREQLLQQFQAHPEWIAFLADEIKARRPPDPDS